MKVALLEAEKLPAGHQFVWLMGNRWRVTSCLTRAEEHMEKMEASGWTLHAHRFVNRHLTGDWDFC